MAAELDSPQDAQAKELAEFRSGVASDETAVRQILSGSNLAYYSPTPAKSRLPPGSIATYICQSGHDVVGVLQVRHLGEEAEVLNVAVPAAHRRQGHARFLLGNFLGAAREHNIRDIFLEVRESNAAARALYQACGFIVSGRRPNYYRDPVEDALLLTVKLTG